MTEIDDRLLIAYVDGELAPADRARVEAAVREDEAIAERLAQHRRLAELAADTFRGTLNEPLPERLLQAVTMPPADVGRSRSVWRFGWPQAVAMAASVLIGVALGRNLDVGRPLVASPRDGLRAGGELASSLERQLASQSDPSNIRVGLTFHRSGGGYCRTFRMSRESLAGLACREDGRWLIRTTAAAGAVSAGPYRTAASDLPAPVLEAVDAMIEGVPLDAAEEARARDARWRSAP